MSSSTPPRRFKPEPIETTVKSSSNAASKQSDPIASPETAQVSPKPTRRFAPQPIETSTKSHRKVAPEPNETTVRSSNDKPAEKPSGVKPRRFNPEPIETMTASNRKKEKRKDEPNNIQASEAPDNAASSQTSEKRPRRRFAPQLIETAKRSRKAGDTLPAILPSDKTEATPGDGTSSPRKARIRPPPAPPGNTPIMSAGHVPQFLDINRARSPLSPRSNSRGSTRSRHSFRVPDLEPIESSESEEGSNPPSLSTSPSAASDTSYMYKEATRMRESVDDRFSGYLLELAARAAEKQLRDQAMAAFPNDDYHEPVDHFINQEVDDSSVIFSSDERDDERFDRRESSFKTVNWELLAMQQHRERLEQEQEKERQRREAQANPGRPTSAQSPWGNAATSMFANSSANRNIIGGWQKDGELERMRSGAKPPMLGNDITFPRCSSPDPARFDPTQGSHALKNSMCYLTEQGQGDEPEGLWHGKESQCNRISLWSQPSSRTQSAGGLWGGCCVQTGQTPPRGPSGLMTPMIEIDNPFEVSQPPTERKDLPPSPPPSNPDIASIDDRLSMEIEIEKEFGDDFITQVYNYLSLGYPSIARNFDEELSKISRIPLLDLRQDDHLVQASGYIRLGEDGNLKDSEITEETCVRWRALRLYIQEWARQQPKMSPGDCAMGGFGVAVRRGSWAI